MKRNNFFLLLVFIITGLYACSPTSPKLQPMPDFSNQIKSENNNVFRRPKVDILFIVDDSGSMSTHQKNLSNNIELFVDEFSKLKLIDYHIGVISTSENDNGELRGVPKYVEAKTFNGLNILKSNVILGTSGSATEMVFAPLVRALSSKNQLGANAGFYRQSAYLIPIFITDAEDQSDEASSKINAEETLDFLFDLKKDKNKILSFGAIVPSNEVDCSRDAFEKPTRIEEFLSLNINKGNNIVSLCDTQFGKKLVDFSKAIVNAVNRPIILAQRPNVQTIRVFFGTQEIFPSFLNGWIYDPKDNSIKLGKDLTLDENQPPDSAIEVYFDGVILQ